MPARIWDPSTQAMVAVGAGGGTSAANLWTAAVLPGSISQGVEVATPVVWFRNLTLLESTLTEKDYAVEWMVAGHFTAGGTPTEDIVMDFNDALDEVLPALPVGWSRSNLQTAPDAPTGLSFGAVEAFWTNDGGEGGNFFLRVTAGTNAGAAATVVDGVPFLFVGVTGVRHQAP